MLGWKEQLKIHLNLLKSMVLSLILFGNWQAQLVLSNWVKMEDTTYTLEFEKHPWARKAIDRASTSFRWNKSMSAKKLLSNLNSSLEIEYLFRFKSMATGTTLSPSKTPLPLTTYSLFLEIRGTSGDHALKMILLLLLDRTTWRRTCHGNRTTKGTQYQGKFERNLVAQIERATVRLCV